MAKDADNGGVGSEVPAGKPEWLSVLLQFLGGPPVWFVGYVYLFPLFWWIGFGGIVVTLARMLSAIGTYMAAFVPFEILF
ncbi:MAG: hypothetical protein KGS72_20975 [Cyanobacteria bacterium REEB67]|nr:hypothetical protein [Cyanobacteria bacterium REEB67]